MPTHTESAESLRKKRVDLTDRSCDKRPLSSVISLSSSQRAAVFLIDFTISGLLASSVDSKRCGPTWASLGPDEIEEYALVVVLQVGQVVGEVGEVVADASLQVLADVMIDCGQRAAATLTDIREVKRSNLGQAVPLPEKPPVHAQNRELRRVVEETRVYAIQALLSQAVGVLASDGPIHRDVIGQIQCRDVALLKELGRGVLESQLIRGRDVKEICVLD